MHGWQHHKNKSKEMIIIQIRKVVPFEGKEWLQLGWGTWRDFGVVGKVHFLDMGGEHKNRCHFIIIHKVLFKSYIKFRILAAIGGGRVVLLRCWLLYRFLPRVLDTWVVQFVKLLPTDYMWTLINIEITFQSKCRNFKLDFSKDFKTFIEVLPATLFLPPINLSDLKKRKKEKIPPIFLNFSVEKSHQLP